MQILLAHGYFLADDSKEREIMKPYPPLGLLSVCAFLKSKNHEVEVFDSTFQSRQAFRNLLVDQHPPIVGLYCNLMTKLEMDPRNWTAC